MRLSEFIDEKGILVVAKLMGPIGAIASNKENAKARNKGVLEFASAMLQNNPKEIMAMLAILDDKDPADYHCSAATVLRDVFNMVSDPELLMLFGLQGQTPASSGSASENTEAQGTLQVL